MIIRRNIDGKERVIELTSQELILASEEYEISCREEDFVSKLRQKIASNFIDTEGDKILLSGEDALGVFRMSGAEIERQLSKCDSYYEAFWDVIDNCIRDNRPDVDVIDKENLIIRASDNNGNYGRFIFSGDDCLAEITEDGCLKIISLEPFLSDINCETISDFLEGDN